MIYLLYADYSPLQFIMEGVRTFTDNPHHGAVPIILETVRKPKVQLLLSMLGLERFFSLHFFTERTLKALSQVKDGDKVVLIEDRHRPILKALKKILPKGAECYLFLHTPVVRSKRTLRRLKAKARLFRLYSFDTDVRKMLPSIRTESSFYRFPPAVMLRPDIEISYDCFFIGLEKGRREVIEQIRNSLICNGLTCNFIILDDAKDFIPYDETLKLMRQCRCIVDVSLNTKGITLRPLEALYWGKKLITNNPFIVNERLYNAQNVFVWGVDDIGKLHDFVRSVSIPSAQEVLQYYDINQWARRITQ